MMLLRISLVCATALSVVDGFAFYPTGFKSPAPRKHLPYTSSAPRSSPHAALPAFNSNPSSLSDLTLHMSDASYDGGASPQMSSSASLTQLNAAFVGDLTADMDFPSEDTSSAELMLQDMMENPQKTWNWGRKQLDDINVNEILNTSVVILLAVAVLAKLTMVDAGMSRGWTSEELATRLAIDNWQGYLHVLRSSPIATKAATSATVYTIGDIIAQRTEGTTMGDLDRPRVLRSMLAGLIGHGPLSHFWYEISDNFFVNVAHLTQWWSFVPKIVVDQTVWGPIWNNSYIIMLGLMKMESFETIFSDMKRTTIPLLVSGLKLWPLAHCVTYGLIPVENRLLWVDMVEILWVTILSAQAAATGEEKTSSNKEEAETSC